MKNIEDKTNKINKLCNKYKMEILHKQGEINMLLINFAEEYNKIWSSESKPKTK